MMDSGKEALLSIIHRQYEQIHMIEAQWGIRFREEDMRPRIDYFHDAIRALTSGSADTTAKHSRLSVEHLAYDITQLRMIQGKPIGRMHKGKELSPSSEIVKAGEVQGLPPNAPQRVVRAELAALYKDYTVMFAAIFAETADKNFKIRSEEIDATVEDIAQAEDIIAQVAAGHMSHEAAMDAIEMIDNDSLRNKLTALLQKKRINSAEQQQAHDAFRAAEQAMDKERNIIEHASLTFATSQLAVYEEAKDLVKKLAGQGLNLAGKFLQTAVSQAAARGEGRGV